MNAKKIMKLKAQSEARRVVKELEATGRASVYSSSGVKVMDVRLEGEDLHCDVDRKAINSIAYSEAVQADMTLEELKKWMGKKFGEADKYRTVCLDKKEENPELQRIVNGLKSTGKFAVIIGTTNDMNAVILTLQNNEVVVVASVYELTEEQKLQVEEILSEVRRELHK